MELINALMLIAATFGLSMATGVMLERDNMFIAMLLTLCAMMGFIFIFSKLVVWS